MTRLFVWTPFQRAWRMLTRHLGDYSSSSLCTRKACIANFTAEEHEDHEQFIDGGEAEFCEGLPEISFLKVPLFLPESPQALRPRSCPLSEKGSLTSTTDTFQNVLLALFPLHGLPQSNHSPLKKLPLSRLLDIAELAHAYAHKSFEAWALTQILDSCLQLDASLQTQPPDVCAHVIHVAILAGHADLSTVALNTVVRGLLAGKIDPAPVLLSVAHRHSLRKLQGAVLYARFLSLQSSRPETGTEKPHPSQRELFLRANHSLMHIWKTICLSPPILVGGDCETHEVCVREWRKIWLNAGRSKEVAQRSAADVLGRLACMERYVRVRLPQCNLPMECAMAALEGFTSAVESFTEHLVDYFSSS